ncbi:MAG: hypothetical protein MUF29_02380 [Chitinophagaceae bacterium]|nr:hypothetical protein [Chitinophagaceae bacterium]
MNTRIKLTWAMMALAITAFSSAQDSVQVRKENNRPNIVIVAKDALSIEGRVVDITLDYIVLDAAPFNSPLKLSAYFIRPVGNYHKIEVEYIRAAIVYEKKKFGRSVAEGAVDGVGGFVSSADNSGASLQEVGAGAIYGLAIGSLVGTAKGLGRKKKLTIPIHGKSENLIFLRNHYQ